MAITNGFAQNRYIYLLTFILLLSGVLSSCNRHSDRPQSSELTVAAAADLTTAFEEIGRQFQNDAGTKVVFSFGSSGLLVRQIENGAPMDVFAAANTDYITQLDSKGLIFPDTKLVYARGQITLWTPKDSKQKVQSLADLTRPDIKRIAIANPEHAPYGKAAMEAFEKSGILEEVKSKLVYAENVRETLQFAQTGNVEVAIVALSLSNQSDGTWVVIPDQLHSPIDQSLAVIKGTKNEQAARQFVKFVTGPKGRDILAKFGFTFP